MNSYKEYSAIKRLIDEYFEIKEWDKYEDFIQKLVKILGI